MVDDDRVVVETSNKIKKDIESELYYGDGVVPDWCPDNIIEI